MATKRTAALGLTAHTGWAALVVVGGPAAEPEILAKGRIDVATTFAEGAVFHAGQEMSLERARKHVRESDARFIERARTRLGAFVGQLGAVKVVAARMAAAEKVVPPLETTLRSHALVHTAEGELYRRVFAAACAALRIPFARVPDKELPALVAAALGLTPARLSEQIAAMGKASGRPWTVDQKQATLAAWLVLGDAATAGARPRR